MDCGEGCLSCGKALSTCKSCMVGLSVNTEGNCVCPVTTFFNDGLFDDDNNNYCGDCSANCDVCDNSLTC
jgi:hypothetical protein